MKLFNALKRFFNRIKDAVKELFGVKNKDDEPIEVKTYEETNYDKEGNVISSKKIEVKNPNGSWKDIWQKISNKAKEGVSNAVDYIIEHPIQFLTYGTIGSVSIGSMLSAFSRVTGTFERMHDKKMSRRTIQDVYGSKYGRATYVCNRNISDRTRNYINSRVANGESMPNVLREMGLA